MTLAPLAIVTPWYPTSQRPFHGSFVAGFADAVHEHDGRPVHVHHLEAWGLPAGTRAGRQVVRDLGRLLRGPAGRLPMAGDGIRVRHIPAPVVPGSTFGRIADDHHRFLRQVAPRLLDGALVHAHVGLGGGWPALAMSTPSTRLFVTEHATFLDRLFEEVEARARYERVIAAAEGFFCVSEVLRRKLIEYFPARADEIEVLPNPIRFSEIPRREREPDLALRRWLYVGYLIERKGVLELLEAFALAVARHRDLELTLVGEGPLAGRLRERASELGVADRVTFAGAVPSASMPTVYAEHDLLVHLSDYETFGMTIVEAVAVGLPVLVTRCGGPEETVGPVIDTAGTLLETREPEAVASAYDALRDDSDRIDTERAREHLERNYSFAAVGAALARRYRGERSS